MNQGHCDGKSRGVSATPHDSGCVTCFRARSARVLSTEGGFLRPTTRFAPNSAQQSEHFVPFVRMLTFPRKVLPVEIVGRC
jgi:hypothetical protein